MTTVLTTQWLLFVTYNVLVALPMYLGFEQQEPGIIGTKTERNDTYTFPETELL